MSTIFGSTKSPNSTALIRILNSNMLSQNEELMDLISTSENSGESRLPSHEERLKIAATRVDEED